MHAKNTSDLSGYKTRQQIANEYGISAKTMMKKLKSKAVELPNGRVGLRGQKRIYEALGYPPGIPKAAFEDI